MEVKLPPALASGVNTGITTLGEMLVVQSGKTQTLSIFDPDRGTVTPVVTRNDSQAQIAFVAGNERWVVWAERRGFDVSAGDWSVWAYERSTRRTKKIAERSLTAAGKPPDSLEVVPSLSGDRLVWAAGREASAGKPTESAYVADLSSGVVRRLADDTYWISAISAKEALGISVDHFEAAGSAVSVVVRFDLDTGKATRLDWVAPHAIAFFAASSTFAILVNSAPADVGGTASVSVVDVHSRENRTIEMPTADWPVAGDRFVAWSTQDSAFALPAGVAEPVLLARRANANWVMASGPWLLWWEGINEHRDVRARLACP